MANVVNNLHDWADRQRDEVVRLANVWAGTLQGRAQLDAKWTNRSGLARGGLFGSTEVDGDKVFIRLSHSMEYGVFLELANNGKFAILRPTIDAASPEIFADYKELWE